MSDGLEKLLAKRASAPESPGLESRILLTAFDESRTRTVGALFREVFVLPHPEYALAASLAAGLLIGLGLGGDSGTQPSDLGDFLYVTEVWL
ncbi:MAG: hypothetical protein EOM26_06975 [Alphaproteobacteria bacterium]|nr:hypothetical protein [Alphaproteobacteria bacterium]